MTISQKFNYLRNMFPKDTTSINILEESVSRFDNNKIIIEGKEYTGIFYTYSIHQNLNKRKHLEIILNNNILK